jgi:hypothetical protein
VSDNPQGTPQAPADQDDQADPGGPLLEPADSPTLTKLRETTRWLNDLGRIHRRPEGAAVPFNPHRKQSGLFDSHGDGHPLYLPAHTVCEPATEPAEAPSEAPQGDTPPEAPQGV